MKFIKIIITAILVMINIDIENIYAQDTENLLLHKAATDGDVEKAKELITKGADVNNLNSLGWTPMHTAIWNRRQNIVELLIENKADINKENGNGETPLYFAAEVGQRSIVEILIKNGANINIISDENKNALTIAREKGQNEIAELLIKNGATEPVVEEERDELSDEANTQEEEQSINYRRGRSRISTGNNGQSGDEIDILADPNEIKERIKTFDGLKKDIEEVDVNSVNEIRKWRQIRNDNRTSLIREVEKQYEREIELTKNIAVDEKAEKTKKSIDDMVKLRIERFSKVSRELILQKREERETERETQNMRTRGRTQTTSRETRRRGTQRGQETGTGTTETTYGRGAAMDGSIRSETEEEPENLIDEGTQEEIDLWLDSDIEDKEDLAESVYEIILTEFSAVRNVAVEEEAKKTTAAIDGILLARQERLDKIINEIAQEREELAQLEAQNQDEDARGRGRRSRGTTGTGRTSQQNQTRTRDRRR